MKKNFSKNDLPDKDWENIEFVSIDTEAMGLNIVRDRLCTIQIGVNDQEIYIVHFPTKEYNCPNLKKLLSNDKILKIFHFARFDVSMIYKYIGIMPKNIVCTRILSKITQTYTQKHSLNALCNLFCKVDLNKKEQSSYWGADELTQSQIEYASKDVVYLKKIYDSLYKMCEKEKRLHIAEAMFRSLEGVVIADVNLFDPVELINH